MAVDYFLCVFGRWKSTFHHIFKMRQILGKNRFRRAATDFKATFVSMERSCFRKSKVQYNTWKLCTNSKYNDDQYNFAFIGKHFQCNFFGLIGTISKNYFRMMMLKSVRMWFNCCDARKIGPCMSNLNLATFILLISETTTWLIGNKPQ